MALAPEAIPSVEADLPIKPDPEEKPALTPPASIEADKQDTGSEQLPENPNEVPEEDDIGEIEPDHYYGGGEIPVFKPTWKQFESFPKFIRKIDKYGMQSGIVKVIPPKEWTDALPQLDQMVKTIKAKNPIMQEFHGTHGIYTQANIEKQRSYNLPQWKALTEESNHQPPARRGERRRNQEKETKRQASLRAAKPVVKPAVAPSTPTKGQKRGRGRSTRNKPGAVSDVTLEEATAVPEPERLPTPASPAEKAETPQSVAKSVKAKKTPDKSKAKSIGPKSVSSRRTHNTSAQADEIDEEAFNGFDYRIDNHEEWTAERCKELEIQYWKSLNFSNPMYGADMPGSLFEDKTTSWNVAHLENLLDVIGQKVPGVNTAYLYLGMWKATFAWHLEDVDLYSINYIHFGAPKQWYSISQRDARKFEKAMKAVWPNDSKNCDQFLRHKTYLVSPQNLKSQYGVEVNRLVHYEGEFVITFPYGYHSGYNLGYNCAESVNFATEAWLEYGKIARKCNCEADSVWIDVYDIERKLRGEPTPEYEEEWYDEDEDEVGDLPTPPSSDKDQMKASRKRKLNPGAAGKDKTKRLRLTVKSPPKPVCVLCPHDYSYEPLLRTEDGNMAHRLCATYVPETYVTGPEGQEIVAGIRNIDKKRLELKCLACRSKHGAVFQCSQKKCARAYHATCAAPAGVSVEIGLTSFYGEDGTEYQDVGIDFRCRFHRPKRSKFPDESSCVEALEKNTELQKHIQGLQKGDCVQYQFFTGDIRAGYIVENRESEQTALLYSVPQKTHIEIEHKYILYLDKANQQLKPPSKDAIPMPAHLAHKQTTSKEDPTTDTPRIDDPFHDPNSIHKWADFNAAVIPRNPSQVNVDLEKPNSVWYYLGKTSTEARAQYTHDLSVQVHNFASNFLDSVAPAPSIGTHTSRHPSGSLTSPLHSPKSAAAGSGALQASPSGKRPRGRPPGSKSKKTMPSHEPWLQAGMVDPAALRHQQAFAAASTPHSGGAKPIFSYQTMAELSKYGPGYRPNGAPNAMAASFHVSPQPPLQLQKVSPLGMTHPAYAEAHPINRATASTYTPRSTISPYPELDPQDVELLKKLAPYPYLLRCAKNRPAVYQSPYGPPGVINEPFLPLPRERPAHARQTSLSQDFLSTRSPSQRETVQGHVRTVSTEKAMQRAQEAERRQREYLERQRAAQSQVEHHQLSSASGSDQASTTFAANQMTTRPSGFPLPPPLHNVARPVPPLRVATSQSFQQPPPREVAPPDAVPSVLPGPKEAESQERSGIHTPPASSHTSGDGTSGSPLQAGQDGAAEMTLPATNGGN